MFECFDDLKEINVYVCLLCLIGLWMRSPNMEIENLKFRSVFKCFHQVLKIWESPKNRGNSGLFF